MACQAKNGYVEIGTEPMEDDRSLFGHILNALQCCLDWLCSRTLTNVKGIPIFPGAEATHTIQKRSAAFIGPMVDGTPFRIWPNTFFRMYIEGKRNEVICIVCRLYRTYLKPPRLTKGEQKGNRNSSRSVGA